MSKKLSTFGLSLGGIELISLLFDGLSLYTNFIFALMIVAVMVAIVVVYEFSTLINY